MKKIIFSFILALITVMSVFSQMEPDFNIGFGVGADFVQTEGIEVPTIEIQVGAANRKFNFILEASIGFGISDILYFPYHLGGLFELKIENVIFLGLGGGLSGKITKESSSYPVIRGSVSINFKDERECIGTKVGLYYDYCFKYGYKIGLRFLICPLH